MCEALVVVWETSDRICGKRLRPLVPILIKAMEKHGHLQLEPKVGTGLSTMSAATIDRKKFFQANIRKIDTSSRICC